MYRLRVIVPLWLLYMLLTGNWAWNNWLFGLGLAVGLAGLLRVEKRPFSPLNVPLVLWTAVRYLLLLAWDLLQSGWQVARLLLDPKLPIRPGIIAIPSGSRSQWGSALSAHAITLTPGELVVEMDEAGVMYTHCLDATKPEAALAAQRKRQALLDQLLGVG